MSDEESQGLTGTGDVHAPVDDEAIGRAMGHVDLAVGHLGLDPATFWQNLPVPQGPQGPREALVHGWRGVDEILRARGIDPGRFWHDVGVPPPPGATADPALEGLFYERSHPDEVEVPTGAGGAGFAFDQAPGDDEAIGRGMGHVDDAVRRLGIDPAEFWGNQPVPQGPEGPREALQQGWQGVDEILRERGIDPGTFWGDVPVPAGPAAPVPAPEPGPTPLSGVDFGAGEEAGPSWQGPPAWSDPATISVGPSIPHGAVPGPGVGAGPVHELPEPPLAPGPVPSWTDDPPLDEQHPEPSTETTLQDLMNHADEEQGYGAANPS